VKYRLILHDKRIQCTTKVKTNKGIKNPTHANGDYYLIYEACKLEVVEREVEDWSSGLRRRHQLDKKLDAGIATECSAAPVASGDRTTLFVGVRTKTAERLVEFALKTSA